METEEKIILSVRKVGEKTGELEWWDIEDIFCGKNTFCLVAANV